MFRQQIEQRRQLRELMLPRRERRRKLQQQRTHLARAAE
jgi:hypothetical protein